MLIYCFLSTKKKFVIEKIQLYETIINLIPNYIFKIASNLELMSETTIDGKL